MGYLVWAVGVLISAPLVFTTLSAAARTGADLAGGPAGSAAGGALPLDTTLDAMLRPASTAEAAPFGRAGRQPAESQSSEHR
jgi:hypothetical protein